MLVWTRQLSWIRRAILKKTWDTSLAFGVMVKLIEQ